MPIKLICLKRLVALAFIATFAGGAGYYAGLNRMPEPSVKRENLLIKYADRTVGELNRGVSTLANCSYIRRMYPALPDKLANLGNVYFAYDPMNPVFQDSYAFTDVTTKTITLMDAFFAEDAPMRESILAHEALHLVTHWGHIKPLDQSKDPIYITITKCFGDLY